MDDLQLMMYRVYKAQREFIKMTRDKKMDYDEFLYLQRLLHGCEEIDNQRTDFLERWLEENEV